MDRRDYPYEPNGGTARMDGLPDAYVETDVESMAGQLRECCLAGWVMGTVNRAVNLMFQKSSHTQTISLEPVGFYRAAVTYADDHKSHP